MERLAAILQYIAASRSNLVAIGDKRLIGPKQEMQEQVNFLMSVMMPNAVYWPDGKGAGVLSISGEEATDRGD